MKNEELIILISSTEDEKEKLLNIHNETPWMLPFMENTIKLIDNISRFEEEKEVLLTKYKENIILISEFNHWLHSVSDKTRKTYVADVVDFADNYLLKKEKMSLKEGYTECDLFVASIEKFHSRNTISKYISALRKFIKFLRDEGIITEEDCELALEELNVEDVYDTSMLIYRQDS